jgi:DNA polymerase
MPVDESSRRYLNAMGIQVWESRNQTKAAQASAPTAEEAQPPRSLEPGPTDPPPEATGGSEEPKPSASLQDVMPPAPRDIPAEYRDWENRFEQGDAEALDFGLETPPSDDRGARIARMDWDALETEVRGCTKCELHASRTQTVFGVGNRRAQWLMIGEAPGAEEDRLGEPFVGRAGKLLDAMLFALGLDRNMVFIANILKCRPPKNRDPTPDEAHDCRPFLDRQIALIEPGIIVALGRVAAQNLLETQVAVGKLRGGIHRLEPAGIPVVVTYHPAYLLRSPREKRKVWDDLQLARRAIQ